MSENAPSRLPNVGAIFALPYASAPSGAEDKWDISTPTQAICVGVTALHNRYGAPIVISAESYPHGWRTADGMKDVLRGYGVTEDAIVELPDGNSTPPQARQFEKWRRGEGIENAIALVHDSHKNRVGQTPAFHAQLVTVHDVLNSGLPLPVSDKEAKYWDRLSSFYDQAITAKYEHDFRIKLLTKFTRLGGLTVMAAIFQALTKNNPNVLTVTGDGVSEPFELVQYRYKSRLPASV